MVCVSSCDNNLVPQGNGSCVLCANGTYKGTGGTCVSNCSLPVGYYADDQLRACYACDSTCLECDGSYP